MRRPLLICLLLTIATLLSACGNPSLATDTPPAATSAPTQLPTQATASSSPTTATTGNPIQVDVTLADNTIESSLTTFQAGVPYTFVIKNEGRHAHNFIISQPVAEAGSLDAALQGALLAVPQSQLPVSATVTVDYTFADSAVGANLEFSCLIRMHYEDGMWLTIAVTQ
jgi:uncharacterized cupredoxin-like copper-binding protein